MKTCGLIATLIFVSVACFCIDSSLSTQEYVNFGAPDINTTWYAEQYIALETVLSRMTVDKLPRFKSIKSGKYFERIISVDNFDAIVNGLNTYEQKLK